MDWMEAAEWWTPAPMWPDTALDVLLEELARRDALIVRLRRERDEARDDRDGMEDRDER